MEAGQENTIPSEGPVHARTAGSSDRELIERARQGDTEAFGELIGAYRSKAHEWAERMTGDPFMADDIVQDALIRAFLHLGSLSDTSRFLPWLHRIVRNQANMRLRRGGAHGKERLFASFGLAAPKTNGTQVEWEDLDSMLYHLTRSAAEAAAKQQDPAELLLRKELYETIHGLLHCLSRRERGIVKAHFWGQLSPEEIAAMYRMTTGSVYTYIYRSRQKLRKEHSYRSLGLISSQKEGNVIASRNILPLPKEMMPESMSFTFLDSIRCMLTMMGDPRDAMELMGISSFAFRMKLSNRTTFSDGIYVFDWRAEFQQLTHALGYEAVMLCGKLADAPVPLLGAVERFPVVLAMEEAVLPFIRRQIDAGKPVMYFDTMVSKPFVHEWAVVYGYDDTARAVYLTDPMVPGGKRISYDDVVYNPVRFLAAIGGQRVRYLDGTAPRASTRRDCVQARRAISFAIDNARHGCGYSPRTSYLTYTSGLAAYDRWIGHLRNPHLAPNRYGMGQLCTVYAEAKQYAALYLRQLPLEGEAMRLVLLASEAYEQAAEAMGEISRRVPFIRTSEVLSPELCETCAVLLGKAKTFESAAVEYLEKSIAVMAKEEGEEG